MHVCVCVHERYANTTVNTAYQPTPNLKPNTNTNTNTNTKHQHQQQLRTVCHSPSTLLVLSIEVAQQDGQEQVQEDIVASDEEGHEVD